MLRGCFVKFRIKLSFRTAPPWRIQWSLVKWKWNLTGSFVTTFLWMTLWGKCSGRRNGVPRSRWRNRRNNKKRPTFRLTFSLLLVPGLEPGAVWRPDEPSSYRNVKARPLVNTAGEYRPLITHLAPVSWMFKNKKKRLVFRLTFSLCGCQDSNLEPFGS